jgi:hypothetical protein
LSAEERACDYDLSPAEADALLGVTLLPADAREAALARFAREHGEAVLIRLFAQLIGLANSVVANNRARIALHLITKAGVPSYAAESVNLPTVAGALNGAKIAHGIVQEGLCRGCAFRLGSAENQSPVTTLEAGECAAGDEPFFCHEGSNGEPTRICAGFAQARRMRKAPRRSRGHE